MTYLKKTLILQVLFFCLLNCFYTITYSQETGLPIIRNYTPKEYDNSPQVMSVIKDDRGIMYFGVETGIMEYDGILWRFITVDDAFYESFVVQDIYYIRSYKKFYKIEDAVLTPVE